MGSACVKPTDASGNTRMYFFYILICYISVVQITSNKILGEWFDQEILNLSELKKRNLDFDVEISHLKLRQLAKKVSKYYDYIMPLQMNCFLEITIDDKPEYTFATEEALNTQEVEVKQNND